MIRPGAAEARVSGVFELHDASIADAVGVALDQSLLPGDQLLITRKLYASGRSGLSVNGQPATATIQTPVINGRMESTTAAHPPWVSIKRSIG